MSVCVLYVCVHVYVYLFTLCLIILLLSREEIDANEAQRVARMLLEEVRFVTLRISVQRIGSISCLRVVSFKSPIPKTLSDSWSYFFAVMMQLLLLLLLLLLLTGRREKA